MASRLNERKLNARAQKLHRHLHDAAGTNAARAHALVHRRTIGRKHANALQIGHITALRAIIRMTHRVADDGTFSANFTDSRHRNAPNGHCRTEGNARNAVVSNTSRYDSIMKADLATHVHQGLTFPPNRTSPND